MSAKSDTWMAFYVGDYVKNTLGLTTRQHGAYLLLILACWQGGGCVEGDEETLLAITKLNKREWEIDRFKVERFFTIADNLWTHDRVIKELNTSQNISQERSKAGTKGAAKRWQKPWQSDAPSQSPSQGTETTTPTVTNTHNGLAKLIAIDWQPSDIEIAQLRKSRPDLVGALYEHRMQDFRDWCRSAAVTSHHASSTWSSFMRKTRVNGVDAGVDRAARRAADMKAAIARGLSEVE